MESWWEFLHKHLDMKLRECQSILNNLDSTDFAQRARQDYGGEGLPLGVSSFLYDNLDWDPETHLCNARMDLEVTDQALIWASEEADIVAIGYLKQYQILLTEACIILQDLARLGVPTVAFY